MKKLFTLLFICVLFLILDNTLVPFFAVRGFYPSLLTVFVVLYSIMNGSFEGLWIGILSGFLQDIYFFSGFGVNAFSNMLICTLAGFIGIGIFKEKGLIPVVSSFALALLKGIIVFVILYIAKVYIPIQNVLYNSLYSMLVAIFMYRWVYRLCLKEYMQRKWSFYDK
ncbi:rod shape-determining protein MreD [Clostridium swellfunianum]|uniref:rod shape-determining protein MreD n=1 Tax=Clostridium swellfunianum TaxID=1367462 RepID=UPI002030882B|nr:rod shape-determining protein MreD [Clostridium swellfunianum]MCM0648961.1 rod shape-determining protein MreD [Clostridium swellfunianum]